MWWYDLCTCIDDVWGQNVDPRESTNLHPFKQRASKLSSGGQFWWNLHVNCRFRDSLFRLNHSHESKSRKLATSALILSLDAEKHTFIAAGQLWPLVITLNDLGGREFELEIHRPASPISSITHYPQMHSCARIHVRMGLKGCPASMSECSMSWCQTSLIAS